jgi:uncharacterized membrane protein YebE (DUF533 family)
VLYRLLSPIIHYTFFQNSVVVIQEILASAVQLIKKNVKQKSTKAVFWIGLILSIGFLSYFEYTKYQAATKQPECTQAECGAPEETSS